MPEGSEDRFTQSVSILNAALEVLPEFSQLLEERKQRDGMTTQDILDRAGARFSENELSLLADLTRLSPPKQPE
jgi:hypothetical protein